MLWTADSKTFWVEIGSFALGFRSKQADFGDRKLVHTSMKNGMIW